eukprot:TRINITY_DN16500_c0_g1_i2.p1 TRINITY_DN16500_c0_g1~~TRINITY_DN16500_c0_g1_i2.p1  ORF type:complete len:317 (-),score=38.94 TRINITY_DN16500_c0_g1_i2:155-1105(-)
MHSLGYSVSPEQLVRDALACQLHHLEDIIRIVFNDSFPMIRFPADHVALSDESSGRCLLQTTRSFIKVYEAMVRGEGLCEVKVYPLRTKQIVSTLQRTLMARVELEVYHTLSREPSGIVQALGYCVQGDNILLIMERGDCCYEDFLVRTPDMDVSTKQHYMLCMINSLRKVHKWNHPLANIKPQNVIMCGVNRKPKFALDLKIFENDLKLAFKSDYRDLCYTAPEGCFSSEEDGLLSSDIWSLGVVLWELFMEEEAFADMRDSEIRAITRKEGGILETLHFNPDNCPENVQTLIKSCLATCPNARPSAEALYNSFN